MYYVTTGKWQNDAKLTARIDNEKEALLELNIFSRVEFTPVDARLLQRLYNSAKNRLTKSVTFSGKVTLPSLPNVRSPYLGYLPADEYLKLITDDSGNIVRSLFTTMLGIFKVTIRSTRKLMKRSKRTPSNCLCF